MTVRQVCLLILLGSVAGCTENVTSISPTSVVAAGPAFKLTVLGSGFGSGDTVQWNGSNRATTYVSTTELIAQINEADIAAAGSASVTVTNPSAAAFGSSGTSGTSGTSGSSSNTGTVSIVAPSGDANAYQIDPMHDGAIALTSDSVSFPTSPTWQLNLGPGAPSNIVIADSKVFLTLGASGGSQLLALDQSNNGATAWGPVKIAGSAGVAAGVAFDDDQVFVAQDQSTSSTGGSTLYAFNADTGALNWSTALGGASPGAPTAADGYVYVIVTASATLLALNETTGAIAWQQSLSGASGTPAVTADGVYVAATTSGCFTIDFRPATGEVIWNTSNGTLYCPQGATPAVANQLVYSSSTSGIAIFDSESGDNSTGSLSYALPAAFSGSTAYFLQGSNLQALNLTDAAASDSVQWSFNGDKELNTPPIVVDGQYVIAGSSVGNLYAVDATSGASVWTQSLGNNVVQLAVGDGLLMAVSETGNDNSGTLTAYTISSSP